MLSFISFVLLYLFSYQITINKIKYAIQPIKNKYKDGSAEEPGVIYNVPVAWHRAGDAFIVLPLKPGHLVTLIFSDKSLEKWLNSGGVVDPEDTRSHHVSDAVAIPGGYPFSDPLAINNDDDIIISNGTGAGRTEMRIKPNGHLQVINQNNELIKVLAEWLRHDIAGSHQGLLRTERKLKTFLQR